MGIKLKITCDGCGVEILENYQYVKYNHCCPDIGVLCIHCAIKKEMEEGEGLCKTYWPATNQIYIGELNLDSAQIKLNIDDFLNDNLEYFGEEPEDQDMIALNKQIEIYSNYVKKLIEIKSISVER